MCTSHTVAVIGAGSWGTALALLLVRNGVSVRLWGHDAATMALLQQQRVNVAYLPSQILPPEISITSDLATAVRDVRDILLVVPSSAFRSLLLQLQPLVTANARFVWGTKGLDLVTGMTLDTLVFEYFGPSTAIAVLSGPSFANEVAEGLPTAVTLASNDDAFADTLIECLRNEAFRLYKSKDVIGVELCGVMKNVLAIATGVCDGLHLGTNARAALLTRGIAELARLLSALGGDCKTLMGLAGIGDIFLTCTTDQSRNRRFGLMIGAGMSPADALRKVGQVVEGFTNTKQLVQLAAKYTVDMPIVTAIYRVLQENVSPQQAAHELLLRENTGLQ